MNPVLPTDDAIAKRAYSLWEQAGRPAGHDQEFWLSARAELSAPARSSGVPPVIAPPLATSPAAPTAAPLHAVPPPIQDAVKTPGRRPAPRRGSKRA